MSRSRNIKPGFFKNDLLSECPPFTRLLFIALWCEADREGRLEYRPKRIKISCMPYDDVDIEDAVAQLIERDFLILYEVDNVPYLQIRNWSKHQNPHHKEIASVIPAPDGHVDTVCAGYIPLSNTIRNRIYERDGRVCRACGATHGLSIDHIIPVSKGGNSTEDNLQVLCLGCNVQKGNKIQSRTMHDSSMSHASSNKDASCPTDSSIPDSLNLIPYVSVPNGTDVGASANRCPTKQIVDLYHEVLPTLSRVEKITTARQGYIRQRWLNDLTTLDEWRNYFQDVKASDFLMGRVNGSGDKPPFRADLEWLCRPGNFAKVAEGKYHRRTNGSGH